MPEGSDVIKTEEDLKAELAQKASTTAQQATEEQDKRLESAIKEAGGAPVTQKTVQEESEKGESSEIKAALDKNDAVKLEQAIGDPTES